MKTCLLLEDNINDVILILRSLRGIILVTPVSDRNDYVRALIENDFDLIITDLNVNTFLDFETVSLARNKCPKVPLIVITGSMSQIDAQKSMLHGASYFIMKNGFRELKTKVREALKLI